MFWIFLAVVIVAAVSVQYFKHRETQKTIRDAMERGQALDSEMVAELAAAAQPRPPNRRGLAFIGSLFVCIGIGLAGLGWLGSLDHPEMLHQALGAAFLLCMLGVPFFIACLMAPKSDGAVRK